MCREEKERRWCSAIRFGEVSGSEGWMEWMGGQYGMYCAYCIDVKGKMLGEQEGSKSRNRGEVVEVSLAVRCGARRGETV